VQGSEEESCSPPIAEIKAIKDKLGYHNEASDEGSSMDNIK
jgi:hypothetical protein